MTYYRPKRVNTTELLEMQVLLEQCGYNPAYAELLQREGMGPYELKDRLRIEPGSVGSLEYTHGMKYWTEQPRRRAMENPIRVKKLKWVILPDYGMGYFQADASARPFMYVIKQSPGGGPFTLIIKDTPGVGGTRLGQFTSFQEAKNAAQIHQSKVETENPVVTIIDDKSLKPIKRIRSSTAKLQQTRAAANVWAMQRAQRTGRGALVITPKQKNPMDLRNPLSLRGKEAVLGVGLIAGVIGIAMLMRSTTASAASTPAPGPVAVTNKDAGPITLRVGNTLNVTLTLASGMTEYLSTSTSSVPTPLTQGASITQSGTTTETWTATAAGTQTISYQGINASNVAVGTPIVFNVTVS